MTELVFLKGKTPLTTSLIVAEGTNNEHRSIVRLIQNYAEQFERWGKVKFVDVDLKSATNFIDGGTCDNRRLSKDGRGKLTTVALLNEQQATFLITLLRNNDIVVAFKSELVDQFFKMREILLNRQNMQWQEIRAAGKVGNRSMCDTIHDVIIPLAREQGSTTPDKIFYWNYQKAVNKAAGVKPKSRDELPLGQLYEIEKLQHIVEVSIKGLAARGDGYKQIYQNTNQTLENYSRLSLITERFLTA